ncbi:MAG: 5'/3'-nucleotidase SurE [Firmicutes bacterium]|nr:5'/3'-nucleotidase SurE [Bacillota bacterium]
MRVLLTNDDGVFADGLRALAEALKAVAEVVVVAPDRERSGTGHAITMHHPLRVQEIPSVVEDVSGWAVDGTPSDCVKLAVHALLKELPDILVSGINRGPNLGTDVLASGTVSAAVEGMLAGIPSVAVSVADYRCEDFTATADFTVDLLGRIAGRGLPPGTILNVNVPSLPRQHLAGVVLTRLGRREYTNIFDCRVDPRGRVYYWLAGELVDLENGCDTDAGAVARNLISVTPLHLDLTNYEMLREMESWRLDLPGGEAKRFSGPDGEVHDGIDPGRKSPDGNG